MRISEMAAGLASGNKWETDDEGNLRIPARQNEYLELLLSDSRGSTRKHAEVLGINVRTLRAWRQDPRFKAEWERRVQERIVGTDRISAVVDVLYDAAVKSRDVAAAREYLKYVERFLPPRRVIELDRAVEAMSDEELEAEVLALISGGEAEEVTDE